MGVYPLNVQIKQNSDGGFTKLEPGDNVLRLLSEPVVAFEVWENKQVTRTKSVIENGYYAPQQDIGKKARIVHAFKAYNYQTKQVELAAFSQKKIINALMSYDRSERWGDVRKYDINIIRTGTTKDDTDYQVQAIPPQPLSEEIKKEVASVNINFIAWINGDNDLIFSENDTVNETPPQNEDINLSDVDF